MRKVVSVLVAGCLLAVLVGVIAGRRERGTGRSPSTAESGRKEAQRDLSSAERGFEQKVTKGTKEDSSSAREKDNRAQRACDSNSLPYTVHTPPSTLYTLPSTVPINRDSTFGTPRFVGERSGFLSPSAPGASPEDVLRAFLEANGRAFTLHHSDVLDPENGAKTRDVVTKHNGMRSVTWRQQHEGLEPIVGS